jgi:hypothetical protein
MAKKMLEGYGEDDDESSEGAGLLAVRSAHNVTMMCSQAALERGVMVGPAPCSQVPLGRLSNRNCGCAAWACRWMVHY